MNQESNMPQNPNEVLPRRRARRAGAAAITASVVAAVIAFNILFSFVADRFMWQLDETVTRYTNVGNVSMYTATEEFLDVMREFVIPQIDKLNAEASASEEPRTINIIFCAERDEIHATDKMRLLQYTALCLQKEFPDHVTVSYIDIEKNPSAVQKYKATSSSNIYSHQIIFEFGTEYRVRAYDYFFLKSDESSTDHWAYNGEQKIASILLALTRAISPIAGFITNHGEDVASCTTFRTLVERAGYDVIDIDLSKDAIPDDCRLLICYDPQTDFLGLGNDAYDPDTDGASEIKKLDDFLDKAYSFMLFVDKDTPELPVLEEYMEEWGVTISRGENADGDLMNYTIRDTVQKLDKDGYTPIADYVTTGTGASLTSAMQDVAYPAKVIFPNATAITMADTYRVTYVEPESSTSSALSSLTGTASTEEEPSYSYGSYYRNGVSRAFYDVFNAGVNATAEAFGKTYEVATEQNRFKLMTLSVESRTLMETNYLSTNEPSYVAVFGSTEFASNALLDSAAYGNADALAATLRTTGHEVLPADLEFKAFKKYSVDTDAYQPDTENVIATTVLMTLLPLALCATIGVCVHVKRRNR